MDKPRHERPPFTETDRLAEYALMAVELDLVLDANNYVRAIATADKLVSEPRNASLIDVMRTGRTYLDPLPKELRHYWPVFITVARHTIKENRGDDETIIRKLYDFIGGVLITPEAAELMFGYVYPIRD